MTDGERLTVRLSSDEITLLKELVYRNEFETEADAVHHAIHQLLESRIPAGEWEEILAIAKSRPAVDINMFIKGDADASLILSKVIERGLDEGDE